MPGAAFPFCVGAASAAMVPIASKPCGTPGECDPKYSGDALEAPACLLTSYTLQLHVTVTRHKP